MKRNYFLGDGDRNKKTETISIIGSIKGGGNELPLFLF